MKATPPPSSSLKSFTLIEILVSIAIISILAALLMPGLKQAREQGYRVTCMNNLRQLYYTASLYQQDNNNQWVLYYDPSNSSWWFQRLFPNKGTGGYMVGPLGAGATHDAGWKNLICPSNPQTTSPGGWASWQSVDYCVNSVGGGKVPGVGGPNYPDQPALIPYLADGIQNYWDFPTIESRVDKVHNGSANVLFFDGHVVPYQSPDLENVLLNYPAWQ